jgi:hypothetical protein
MGHFGLAFHPVLWDSTLGSRAHSVPLGTQCFNFGSFDSLSTTTTTHWKQQPQKQQQQQQQRQRQRQRKRIQ